MIDRGQETVQFGLLSNRELVLRVTSQQIIEANLGRRSEQAFRQCLQLSLAQANQQFGIIVHGSISGPLALLVHSTARRLI